jgi:D-lactate dehydrogenase
MKLAIFSAKPYDREYLGGLAAQRAPSSSATIESIFIDKSLSSDTAALANGADAVCVFVHDTLDASVLQELHAGGVRAILLRCAGYNNVDLGEAEKLGLFVANVPSYSPEGVAEFAIALILTLYRKTHQAYNRVREGNFNIDGLLGRMLHGKTVGIVGVGRIGLALARILQSGFGCRLVAYDPFPTEAFRQYGEYTSDVDTLLGQCDIVSLHCPLTDSTRHIINETTLAAMKQGAMLVNTSRGGLIDTRSVVEALKSRYLGGLALDVYEDEGPLFYSDHSGDIIEDDLLMRLTTFYNVVVSGHQAFFTEEALTEIAECTLRNLDDWSRGVPTTNALVQSGGGPMARRDSRL